MKTPLLKPIAILPSLMIPCAFLGLVIYKLVFEFNELEKWRILLLAIGGTLTFCILLTYLIAYIYFKKRAKRIESQ